MSLIIIFLPLISILHVVHYVSFLSKFRVVMTLTIAWLKNDRLTSSYLLEGSCHICYLCLFAHSGVQHPLTILVTWWIIQEHLRSSSVCVALCFSVLSCGFFFFVTCLLCPVLPVYMDCLFVLALSVFSDVYFNKYISLMTSQRQECIPCNYNYSIKHILIDCLDVSDVRQNFYNVNNLYHLFTNVTILKFLKEIDLYSNI